MQKELEKRFDKKSLYVRTSKEWSLYLEMDLQNMCEEGSPCNL